MKRKLISIFLVVVLLQYFYSFVFAENITNEEAVNEQKNLNEMNQEVTEQINQANTKLEYVQSELSNTMLQVQELEDKILGYQKEMTGLSDKLDALQNSIDETKQKLTVAEEEYNRKEELLRERLVAMYEDGETQYLDILLSSRNIVEFISGYYLINEFVEYDNTLMQEVAERRDDIEITKTKLEKEETEIKLIKAKREQTTVVLQNTITLQESYAKKLSKQEQELKNKITEYKQEQARIEALIQQATNSSNNLDIQYTGGEMLWPVAISGTVITSTYGVREHPIQGVIKEHSGLDIGNATYGSPVVAAADGVVTYAGWLGGYGNCVMLNHGNGLVTLYGHGQKIITELHKKVKKGDLIMEVGSTGNSTGPHLHFEIRKATSIGDFFGNNWKDPLDYLPGGYTIVD